MTTADFIIALFHRIDSYLRRHKSRQSAPESANTSEKA